MELTKPDVNQPKIDALSRKKKIEIFKSEDTSETQKQIDSEFEFPTGRAEDLQNISPRISVASFTLSPMTNHNVNSEIVQKMKYLADRGTKSFVHKNGAGILHIDKSNLESYRLKYGIDFESRMVTMKISMASNIIATESRYGSADFIITNQYITNRLIDVEQLRKMCIKLYVDNSIKDEIIVGRKSDTGQSGLQYLLNDTDPQNISYSISELGFFPEKNFLSIGVNI